MLSNTVLSRLLMTMIDAKVPPPAAAARRAWACYTHRCAIAPGHLQLIIPHHDQSLTANEPPLDTQCPLSDCSH